MSSARNRLGWIAVGLVALFNLCYWIPPSMWAFTIAASSGLIFLLSTRKIYIGSVAVLVSLVLVAVSTKILPGANLYYSTGYALMMLYIPASLMAIGIRNGMSAFRTQLMAIVPFIALIAMYMLDLGGVKTGLGLILDDMSESVIDWYRAALQTMPQKITPEEMNLLKSSIRSLFDFLYRFFPGLMLCWAIGMNIVAYYFAGLMIGREGGYYRQLREFRHWKAGLYSMIVLAASLLIWIVGIEPLRPIVENVLFLFGMVYMICGFAVIEYYLRKRRVHTALRVTVYILLILSGWFGGGLAAVLGLIDSHFDFRQVKAREIG